MSVLAQLEAKAKPENVSKMSAAMADIFPENRKYDGCIDIMGYLNEDGHPFVFVEHW